MGKTQQLGMYPNIGISSSGTPTTNYLPKFTGASTIGNSLIFDNGTSLFIGNGQSSATPQVGIIEGTDGSGTNIAGAEFRIQGGQGTGTGAGGAITLYTAPAGSTGSSLNTAVERMRIDTSGRVGIGTSSIDQRLVLQNGTSEVGIKLTDGTNNTFFAHAAAANNYGNGVSAGDAVVRGSNGISLAPNNGSATAMRITSSGNVGIGTSSPIGPLDIAVPATGSAIGATNAQQAYDYSRLRIKHYTDSNLGLSIGYAGANYTYIQACYNQGTTAPLFLNPFGSNVAIGTTSPAAPLHVASSSAADNTGVFQYENTNTGTGSAANAQLIGKSRYGTLQLMVWEANGIRFGMRSVANGSTGTIHFTTGNDSVGMTLAGSNLTVNGALSKGSGSFRIEHPIESMKDTHHLVHSFVESPQANNIYRGKVQLVDGKAEVNLDEVSTMTEGTFVLLNREIHTYTSNETDWDAVRGKVDGNILTIECQNNQSNAMVSWLVIGERQDKHMMDTEWTDDNGKVIVEPLKEVTALENK